MRYQGTESVSARAAHCTRPRRPGRTASGHIYAGVRASTSSTPAQGGSRRDGKLPTSQHVFAAEAAGPGRARTPHRIAFRSCASPTPGTPQRGTPPEAASPRQRPSLRVAARGAEPRPGPSGFAFARFLTGAGYIPAPGTRPSYVASKVVLSDFARSLPVAVLE